jgi:hypothetical protein
MILCEACEKLTGSYCDRDIAHHALLALRTKERDCWIAYGAWLLGEHDSRMAERDDALKLIQQALMVGHPNGKDWLERARRILAEGKKP